MTRIKKSILNLTLNNFKAFTMLSILALLLNACLQNNNKPANIGTKKDIVSEPSAEQLSAFDALNKLQVSTDERNILYSTFAGIDQPCYPPDTSVIISQKSFLMAMQQFVSSQCTMLDVKERNELAAKSVLAQEEYNLSLCLNNISQADFENGIPMKGIWVLPNVLGLRDVIIEWR